MNGAPRPDPVDVRVWHARTRDAWRDPARVERARSWLSDAERARYDRHRFDADRAMFLLGRAMARTLVGRALGVAPLAWTWREGARGRPEVAAPDPALHFNLAHSTGLVVCALAWRRSVGVDVEDRARHAIDRRLVRRFCAVAEAEDVEACGEAWRDRFLQYWTLKEAYLKARGLGIAVHLADVRFEIDPAPPRFRPSGSLAHESAAWACDLQPLDAGHYVAVAAPDGDGLPPPRFTYAPLPLDWLP